MQTQLALVHGDWRLRKVDYDNAPSGRETHAAAPYRWWLTVVAWAVHSATGSPLPLAVEQAALYADPLLHVFLIISVVWFVRRHFGRGAAAGAALALATFFPLAGGFQPGAPDDHALSWVCAIWSLLPLLAGLRGGATMAANGVLAGSTPARTRHLFVIAGIAGGLGMWIDRTSAWPVVVGIGLGAIIATVTLRRDSAADQSHPTPWRLWTGAGSAICLVGYLVEYFPSHVTWAMPSIHPLHAVAWLGLGELIVCVEKYFRIGHDYWNARTLSSAALAVLAIAALPVAMKLTESGRWLASDPFAAELANLPTAAIAPSVRSWLSRDGLTPTFAAACLPVLLVGWAAVMIISRKTPAAQRHSLLVLVVPALVVLGLAGLQLRVWNLFDAIAIILLVATASTAAGPDPPGIRRWVWAGLCLIGAIPGLLLLWPPAGSRAGDSLSGTEVQSVVERDLAYWLVQQNGPEKVVVFTTPALTETLVFYGGLAGIGTYDWENRDGFSAAVRMASATTLPEALALLNSRGVSHIVVPSWDATLDQLVRLGLRVPDGVVLPDNALVTTLHQWKLPPWLRTMTYHLPKDGAFQEYYPTVFTMQAELEGALAACRLADYFVEMGMLEQARAIRAQLGLYPRDLAALTALAQVDKALGDIEGYQAAWDSLRPYLARRAARSLPFDRRISLAALLVQANETDAAREQMTQCLAEINSAQVRALTTGALVRLLAMSQYLGLPIPDPEMRSLALSLLPLNLRDRLEAHDASEHKP